MPDPTQSNDTQLDILYRDTVLDHFRSPRGHKTLDRVDVQREGYNPICGDRMTMTLKISGDTIEDVAIDARGCAISVAAGSMLAELVPGLTKTQAHELVTAFRGMMHDTPPPPDLDLGDLDALEGVKNFPVRVKCALLAWMTLDDALRRTDRGEDSAGGITITEDSPS